MRFTGLVAGLLFLSTASFGASPQLLNLVMPDADTVADVNVSTAKLSPFGQFLLTKLQSGNAGFEKLTATTGFNPLTDVTEILLATSNPANHTGFVAALGNFNPDQLASALANDPNVTVSTYDNAKLFTMARPKTTTTASIAIVGTSLALAGDTPTVQAALDRSSGTNTLPAALAGQINTLTSNQNDAWLVSNASVSSLLPAGVAGGSQGGGAMATQFLKSILAFDAGVKFGESTVTTVDLTADTVQNAEALANVAQMLISFGSANAGTNQSNPQLAAILGLLKNATVVSNGTIVAINLTVPEAQLETIVGAHSAGN